jgi:hypothetical protein
MSYSIRYCNPEEVDKLQGFLGEKWKKNHVLSSSKELLDFQHFDATLNKYQFIIAWHNQKKEIHAVLGVIPTYLYDRNLIDHHDFWLAIWKVDKEKAEGKSLGIEILEFFYEKNKVNFIAAIGITKLAKKIYKHLGYEIKELNHYYIINSSCINFRILQIKNEKILNQVNVDQSDYTVKVVDELKDIIHTLRPVKSHTYFYNKYKNHPFYKYTFLEVSIDDKPEFYFIGRKIDSQGSACFRIIDVYGDMSRVNSLSKSFDDFMELLGVEYIDFLNFGIKPELIHQIGFSTFNEEDLVIPQYFEPFKSENKKIQFAFKIKEGEYTFFKGDADQDRPNKI